MPQRRRGERFHGGLEQVVDTLSSRPLSPFATAAAGAAAGAARHGKEGGNPLQADPFPVASDVGVNIRTLGGEGGAKILRSDMEANAGMVAGSHKRNELVLIRHEGEGGVRFPLP